MIKYFCFIAFFSLTLMTVVQAQENSGYPSVDAPSGSTHGPSAAGSGSGTGSGTNASAQTCTDSCNRSYNGCMDHNAAVPGNDFTLQSSNNAANNLIGGPSDCSDSLRKCLNTCGG